MLSIESSTSEKLLVEITTSADPTAVAPEFAVGTDSDPSILVAEPKDVIGLLDPSDVLFYSLPTVGADPHVIPEWALGQPDPSLNDDGTPRAYGWSPNVAVGSPPYSDADYAAELDPADGRPRILTSITDGFATSNAAQMWRRSAWDATPGNFGSDLSADLYFGCLLKMPQQIYYLNSSGPSFGFTNMIQWYSIAGANTGPFLTMGLGTNLDHNETNRWHFDMPDASGGSYTQAFDLAHLVERSFPIEQYVWSEQRVRVSNGSDGRWEIWEGQIGDPATKLLDFTGGTVGSGSTRYGVSWGTYGTLATPTNHKMAYRQIYITSKPLRPLMQSGSSWATGSWASSWDATTGKIRALTPLVGAGQALDVSNGPTRLWARWTVAGELPVREVTVLQVV